MTEIWKRVPRFPDYAASSLGNVKRVSPDRYGRMSGKNLKPDTLKNGYKTVRLFHEGEYKVILLNRLVCAVFHGEPTGDKDQAAHVDGINSDNSAGNLMWKTRSENEMDKHIHGTMRTAERHHQFGKPISILKGEKNYRAKLTESAVRQIRKDSRPQSVIAAEFGVSQTLISAVRTRKIWTHV